MTLAYLSAAVLAGTALSLGWGADAIPGWRPPAVSLLLWSAAAVAVVWVARSRALPVLPAVVVLAVIGGLWRGGGREAVQPPPEGVEARARIMFEGALLTDPRPFGDTLRLPVRADALLRDGEITPVGFTVDVLAARITDTGGFDRSVFEFRYGDRYRISGTFEPAITAGRVGFVRRPKVTLLGEGEGNAFRRRLARTRARLAESIRSAISEPVAGLAVAVTTGERSGLAPDVTRRFRESGTSHLLAISGLHVAIIAAGIYALAVWAFGRRRQLYLLAPFAAVWGYALIAGMSEPVTRAAIMASVYLAARALGRQRWVLPALGLAAGLMVLLEPESLGKAGFQLSFAAVAGIAVIAPRLIRVGEGISERIPLEYGWLKRVMSALTGPVSVGLAATIATVPLVALHFGAVPVWGIPATLVALLALPFLVLFAAITGALGLVAPALADISAIPAWLAGAFTIETVKFFAALPPGPIDASGWTTPLLWGWYGVLGIALAGQWIGGGIRRRLRALTDAARTPGRFAARSSVAPRWLVGLAVATAIAAIAAASGTSDQRLRVTFFETDRGDMILIETPNGRQALVDGGQDPDGAVRALGERLPFWDRSLDLVVLTHPHADHVGGLLKVLERYKVDRILDSPVEYDTAIYGAWLRAAAASRAQRIQAAAGEWIAFDEDVRLAVINAAPAARSNDINDGSIVLALRYRDTSFLLTGDITESAERRLIESGADLAATVLKVPHQGSGGSSSLPFLRAVSPAISVIPVGTRNPFGHPAPETIERFAESAPGSALVITAERGDVTVLSNGERVWLATER